MMNKLNNLKIIQSIIFLNVLFTVHGQVYHSFKSSILLEFESDNEISFGSGFVLMEEFNEKKYFFVVTARHVLGKLNHQGDLILKKPYLKILRNNSLNDSKYAYEYINLENLKSNGFLIWNEKIDIASFLMCIESKGTQYFPKIRDQLQFFSSQAPQMYYLKKTQIITTVDSVKLGNDIFISGYPKTIGLLNSPQYDYNKPLVRKGIISGFNHAQKTFVLDVQVHGGFSGSPIFIEKNGESKILGLLTERIPFYENKNSMNDLDNSGFSIALQGFVIRQMIEEFVKYISENKTVLLKND